MVMQLQLLLCRMIAVLVFYLVFWVPQMLAQCLWKNHEMELLELDGWEKADDLVVEKRNDVWMLSSWKIRKVDLSQE